MVKLTDRVEITRLSREQRQGVVSTVMASFFLGWAPILGKLAYRGGVTPFTLAAFRTVVAALSSGRRLCFSGAAGSPSPGAA